MRIIKWIFIIIIALIALLLIVSALMPKERIFTQSVEIEKSPRVIFNQLNSLQSWGNWSPFQEADPEMTSEYMGFKSGVGNRQEWKSKVNGNGSMEIIKSVNERKVVFILDLGMGNVDTTWFALERNSKNVVVTWETKMSNLGYPMGRLMMTLFKGNMEKVFMKGLENLKKYVEEQPADCISGEIEIIDVPARSVIAFSGKATAIGMEDFFKESFGALMAAVQSNGLKMNGFPFAIYEGDETTVEWGVTSAFPVNRIPSKLPEGVVRMDLPQTKAVTLLHSGAYETTSDSYYKILDYITGKELQISGNCWEEYVSDPSEVSDPLKIQTRIYFPVK